MYTDHNQSSASCVQYLYTSSVLCREIIEIPPDCVSPVSHVVLAELPGVAQSPSTVSWRAVNHQHHLLNYKHMFVVNRYDQRRREALPSFSL